MNTKYFILVAAVFVSVALMCLIVMTLSHLAQGAIT